MQLIDNLKTYLHFHPEQRLFVETITAFVDTYPDCYERTQLVGHLTASAWIVNDTTSHTALILHHKLGKWLQPGGHADGERDLVKVAMDEAQSETGLCGIRKIGDNIFDIDVHQIPATQLTPAHLHYDIRYAFSVAGLPVIFPNHESKAAAWVALDEIAQFTTEPSILRMVKKSEHLSGFSPAPGGK